MDSIDPARPQRAERYRTAQEPLLGLGVHDADLPRLLAGVTEGVEYAVSPIRADGEEQPAGGLGFHQERHEHRGDVGAEP